MLLNYVVIKCKENVERKVLQCSVQSHSNSFGVSYHDRTIFFLKNTLVYPNCDIHFPSVLVFFIFEWQVSFSGLRTLIYAANCPELGIKEQDQLKLSWDKLKQ